MRVLHSLSHRNRQGFTLIELLVALTILGLLTSLGAGLLHLGQRSWAKTNQASRNVSSVEAVQSLLRNELAQAQPILITTQNGSNIAFSGTSNSLSFYGALPMAFEKFGISEIAVGVVPSQSQGNDLIIRWRATGSALWSQSTLLRSIQDAHFSYYKQTDGVGGVWSGTWSGQTILPQAIKLGIDFASGDKRFWPELIVTPLITANAITVHTSAIAR